MTTDQRGAGDTPMRHATIQVRYMPHGQADIDWAYHLRMGDLDAEEATVIEDIEVVEDDRHAPIPQVGSNICVCGYPVDDPLAHWSLR